MPEDVESLTLEGCFLELDYWDSYSKFAPFEYQNQTWTRESDQVWSVHFNYDLCLDRCADQKKRYLAVVSYQLRDMN